MNAKIIITTLVVLAVGAGIWIEFMAAIDVQTAIVTRADMRAWLTEKAKTSLPRTHQITMPLTARVLPIKLVEGDRVKMGQVIASLDRSDLESAVEERKATVSGLEARIRADKLHAIEDLALREHKTWMLAIADVIEASRQKERASGARLEYANWWLKSQEEAVKTNATPVQMLREARMQTATADVGLTSDRLATSAMLALETAFKMFPSYLSEYLALKAAKREELALHLQVAKVSADRAIRDHARSEITSPVAGVVLRRFVQDETVLAAGTPLVEIGDLGQLRLIAEVLTQDALAVHEDHAVEILGLGKNPLHGLVSRVRPKAFTKLSSLGVEQQRVEVLIVLDPAELTALAARGLPIGVGYHARVRIYTEERDAVIIVPRRALLRASDKRWQVFVVRAGRVALSAVELGILNERQAEVLRGLSAGDRVIVSPPASLRDGDRVAFVE